MATEKKTQTEKKPDHVVKYPLSTEKAIRMMEAENTLLFVVDMKANRSQVKQSIESLFKAKVENVNVYVTNKAQKRAYVRFSPDTPAIDIATQLGLM